MLSIKRLFKSFHYASRGIVIAWKYEQSFRIQVAAALVIVALIFWFQLPLWQAIALLLLIILVLTLELINSILERFVDVFKPRIHPMVEEIKDLMAGAVLIASLGALIVGLLIFVPYFLSEPRALRRASIEENQANLEVPIFLKPSRLFSIA